MSSGGEAAPGRAHPPAGEQQQPSSDCLDPAGRQRDGETHGGDLKPVVIVQQPGRDGFPADERPPSRSGRVVGAEDPRPEPKTPQISDGPAKEGGEDAPQPPVTKTSHPRRRQRDGEAPGGKSEPVIRQQASRKSPPVDEAPSGSGRVVGAKDPRPEPKTPEISDDPAKEGGEDAPQPVAKTSHPRRRQRDGEAPGGKSEPVIRQQASRKSLPVDEAPSRSGRVVGAKDPRPEPKTPEISDDPAKEGGEDAPPSPAPVTKTLLHADFHSASSGVSAKRRYPLLRPDASLEERKSRTLSDFVPHSPTLDPDSAHEMLLVHDDLKSVRRLPRPSSAAVPASPARFLDWYQVISSDAVPPGRRYWTVDVSASDWCEVGVAPATIPRHGFDAACTPGGGPGSWCLWKWGEACYARHGGVREPVELGGGRLPAVVGVMTDTERGELGFYDDATGRALRTFDVAFAQPLHCCLAVYRGRVVVKDVCQ